MALTGQQVVNDDARGALGIGQVLLGGLQGYIDIELADAQARLMGDRATTNAAAGVERPPGEPSSSSAPLVNTAAAVDTVRNLAWWQWGGLLLAGGLTWALITGRIG